MRHTLGVAALVAATAVVSMFHWKPARSPAEHPRIDRDRPASAATPRAPHSPLPITHVVLFSSGVGYFQRTGEVEGNTRIDLAFPVQDINDLLKSMVLQDLGGGQVSAVSYDSHDP